MSSRGLFFLGSGHVKHRFCSGKESFPHLFPKILLEDQKDNQTFTKAQDKFGAVRDRLGGNLLLLPNLLQWQWGEWLGRNPVGPSSCPHEQPPGAALFPLLPLAELTQLPVPPWAWGWPWGSEAGEMPGASEAESVLCYHWYWSSKKWSDESLEAAAHSECQWQIQS